MLHRCDCCGSEETPAKATCRAGPLYDRLRCRAVGRPPPGAIQLALTGSSSWNTSRSSDGNWQHSLIYSTEPHRTDSRFAPSQWETALLCNDVSHWLGASVESALPHDIKIQRWEISTLQDHCILWLFTFCGKRELWRTSMKSYSCQSVIYFHLTPLKMKWKRLLSAFTVIACGNAHVFLDKHRSITSWHHSMLSQITRFHQTMLWITYLTKLSISVSA